MGGRAARLWPGRMTLPSVLSVTIAVQASHLCSPRQSRRSDANVTPPTGCPGLGMRVLCPHGYDGFIWTCWPPTPAVPLACPIRQQGVAPYDRNDVLPVEGDPPIHHLGGQPRPAWPAVDPLLRTCWAQLWAEPLWARMQADGFRPDDVIAALTEESPLRTWGASGNHRLIAPDIELTYLTPHQGPIPPGGQFIGTPFLMRYSDDAWRVLNFFSERLPQPGWPPQLT